MLPHPIDADALVYVAGHGGMVGGAVVRELERRRIRWVGRSSAELDLRDAACVEGFFRQHRPSHVVLAAAKVGGILANATYPADFLSDNLRIQVNVLDAAARYGVDRLLFLGSSCIYPRLAPQPIQESSLLTGPLEPTNDAYAIAKIAGVLHVQALRRQKGVSFISAMPTNIYGPGDNFSKDGSHVLPGLLRRMHDAEEAGVHSVSVWGSGTPRREFLHADDLGRACVFLLEHYDDPAPINVGTGADVTIRELAELVAHTVGFRGELEWDASKPDGTPRKRLDVTRLQALGWTAQIPLAEGVRDTYSWFRDHVASDARL